MPFVIRLMAIQMRDAGKKIYLSSKSLSEELFFAGAGRCGEGLG